MRLYQETVNFEFNGKTLQARIFVNAELDPMDPADVFEFPEDLEKIQSGELDLVSISVEAHFGGLEGSDYLGACTVASGWEYQGTGQDQIRDYESEHGMIENAIEDLKKNMTAFFNKLSEGK